MSSNYLHPPQRGASMLLAFRPRITLIVGSNRLAAARALSALEAGSAVVILSRVGASKAIEELRWRAENKDLEITDLDELAKSSDASPDDGDVRALESFLDSQTAGSVSLAFVTDTLIATEKSERRSRSSAERLYDVCRRRNIPTNVTDMPDLCDFTVCATHRFVDKKTGMSTPLQLGITTNGEGCRLAGRLKREVVARLPPEVGVSVEKVGRLRRLAKSRSQNYTQNSSMEKDAAADVELDDELNEEMTVPSPNRPVEQRSPNNAGLEDKNETEGARRRMKWVAQISEYWALDRLANLTDNEMENLLSGDLISPSPSPSSGYPFPSQHDLILSSNPKEGRVLLVGSGPGHPSLLTLAAHSALTKHADLILSDKLVPSAVLSLIPPHMELHIARKFPGNAEGAQQELMDMALAGARAGRTVVRLKQGDPAVFGRVGEEVLFLKKHGVDVLVVPGISSALAAPLLAHIPVTQRGAADEVVVCTGVGRGGAKGRVPPYERGRTVVLLMGVARLESLVNTLLAQGGDSPGWKPYAPHLPAAIIERASMPDQRAITAPLRDIVAALESVGEQRPPGLLVVGWAVISLWGEGDMSVLDGRANVDAEELDVRDKERVERWLEGRRWKVNEGLDPMWDMFDVSKSAMEINPSG